MSRGNLFGGLWLFLLLLGIAPIDSVVAEGRCPPGQYPIGDQGVGGCAPIPGAGGGTREPEPAGQWHKTWGAIASSPSTAEAGVATGRATKEDAERVALEGCGMHAARDCRILIAYRNQCAAWVVPQSQGNGARGGVASGQDLKEAIVQAQKICVDPTGTQCKVAYSACSEPVYEAF
ncbi:DUF4189 domain-containing protein [Stenotrophomonas maltophilia]|uniref:DUF4189 domain-containing protein n=1 Tax=Stenotrophomonas maltophilia TaxID=40324 RepID=UPI000F67F613|nr:DUF4189 domain-containing protein [Stenotrophomonas maltophilia]MBA0280787.1 DUF4189 domain-containing protein [Stenotrophomonas maltophilia]MBA0344733.1 DUF4189 domain-containing protein [Stenotrophomonas maltophilia]MBA0357835.1 DUF4189 domain-containing protein [Stenotrophomonas maltophilia]MBA0519865.1 DUF4189 domain-containing protein [Stenotrophomonas maltophilia]MDT3487044.1 DUF4189 domain-containing protein [Stenotrophomonas maltophilia]